MKIGEYFPVWDKLNESEKKEISDHASMRHAETGTVLHNGLDCVGFFVVGSGQLRAFVVSEEGREMTLFRLFDHDVCLFSASCVIKSIQFDITIEVEKDADFWVIPPDIYKGLMEKSVAVANYTNQIMASRMSDAMWLIEQLMWKSFDKRLAAFLIEESTLNEDDTLHITHEKIAAHIGSAREVVTRMLNYFQSEGIVRLSRGTITIIDRKKLQKIIR